MKALLNEKFVEEFHTKTLYSEVLSLFDQYNAYQVAVKHLPVYPSSSSHLHEGFFQKNKGDPTFFASVKLEACLHYVYDFEEKIDYLKTQFTEEEMILFECSLRQRQSDKQIIAKLAQTEHKYYELKKSCYLKIALCFGIVKPKLSYITAQEMEC